MKTIIVIIASIVLMGCSRGVCDSYRAHNVTSKNQTSGFVKNIKKNLHTLVSDNQEFKK